MHKTDLTRWCISNCSILHCFLQCWDSVTSAENLCLFFCYIHCNLIRAFSDTPHAWVSKSSRSVKKKKKGGLAAWSNVKTALVFIQCGKEWRFVHLVLKATETSCWQIFESGLISFRFMMSWVALDHRCANSKMGELDSRCQPLSSVVRIDNITVLTSIRAISCASQVPCNSVCETFY